MSPCEVKNLEPPVATDLSMVSVAELDGEQPEKLPIEARIGLCLLANEALLQRTPFLGIEPDTIPKTIAHELGLDPEASDNIDAVKHGLKRLRDAAYLGFQTVHLPVAKEDYRHERHEEIEMHIQPVLTPKFQNIFFGTIEAARDEFPAQ